MLAAQYTENGSDFSTIKLVEVARPTAELGLAVVRIKTAAVNPIDITVMAGALVDAAWAMPLPFSLGYDFSGVIADLRADDAAGAFQTGDAVFDVNLGQHKHDEGRLPTGGAFAQYIEIPEGCPGAVCRRGHSMAVVVVAADGGVPDVGQCATHERHVHQESWGPQCQILQHRAHHGICCRRVRGLQLHRRRCLGRSRCWGLSQVLGPYVGLQLEDLGPHRALQGLRSLGALAGLR